MDIDKLIERLRAEIRGPGGLLEAAATALSTLQAKNERLLARNTKLKDAVRIQRNGVMELRAELERVTMERDAAIGDIDAILAQIEMIRVSVENPDVGEDWALSIICQKFCERDGDHCFLDAGFGRCGNFQWKKPEDKAEPVQAMDEITEITRDQWDWRWKRFIRKED